MIELMSFNKRGRQSRHYVVSGTAKIYYHIYGVGRPILMIHGNMQRGTYFSKQIKYFSDRYQVITIDSRGHGRSEFETDRLTLDIMAEDVIRVIDGLKLERLILLGFSDGGNIAIKLAQLIPDRLEAVISVGSNISPEGLKRWAKVPIGLIYRCLLPLSRWRWLNRKAQILSLMLHEPNIERRELEEIHVPVMILVGEYDLIHKHHSEMMADALPDSKFLRIRHGGHNLLRSHDMQANAQIQAFIDMKDGGDG